MVGRDNVLLWGENGGRFEGSPALLLRSVSPATSEKVALAPATIHLPLPRYREQRSALVLRG